MAGGVDALLQQKRTGVWWDLNTCPVPAGVEPRRVRGCIESALYKEMGYRTQVHIEAFGNLEYMSSALLEEISSSGILVSHAPCHCRPVILDTENEPKAFFTESVWENLLNDNMNNAACEMMNDDDDPLFICETCSDIFKICGEFITHLNSEQHINELFGIVPRDSDSYEPIHFCQVCNYPGYDDYNMLLHNQSEQHIRKVNMLQSEQQHIPKLAASSRKRAPLSDGSFQSNKMQSFQRVKQEEGGGTGDNVAAPPKLINSLPGLSEDASYLNQATSYLGSCFSHYSESEGNSPVSVCVSPGARCSTSSESPTSAANSPSAESTETPSQASNAIVTSNWLGLSGISMFQGLIERALRTVRGSADDIGWLQHDPEMPPVEDGTERFNKILEEIGHGVHRLPNTVLYLLIPGLFSNHGPLYFVDTKTKFSKMGLACHIAKIHSESSVEKNAREIKEYIEELCWGSNKKVLLLGHSKGGIDAAAALSLYWPDLKDKVAGLVLAQSPYGGSPIATDILREGQLGGYVNLKKILEIMIFKVIKGDIQALEDLTYERRKQFLKNHPLPQELATVSFLTEASISPAVLATLSRVAQAELPLTNQAAKLPVVMPLGAAMAACAQLIQVRYGEKSDGLVTCCDAEVPGSVVVRPKRKLDHAWMVYSSLNEAPLEADAAQVCEALLTLLVQVEEEKQCQLD
ncbi:hypothetical protein Bca4012_081250 [Brassica carinata]